MPTGLGRRTGLVCAGLLGLIPAVMLGAAWFQNPVGNGGFEFGVERTVCRSAA